MIENDKNTLLSIVAKYRADLMFDEFVGIFERVPASVRDQLYDQYHAAITAISAKLNISSEIILPQIEDMAVDMIQGMAYTQADVQTRLNEYGIDNQIDIAPK